MMVPLLLSLQQTTPKQNKNTPLQKKSLPQSANEGVSPTKKKKNKKKTTTKQNTRSTRLARHPSRATPRLGFWGSPLGLLAGAGGRGEADAAAPHGAGGRRRQEPQRLEGARWKNTAVGRVGRVGWVGWGGCSWVGPVPVLRGTFLEVV